MRSMKWPSKCYNGEHWIAWFSKAIIIKKYNIQYNHIRKWLLHISILIEHAFRNEILYLGRLENSWRAMYKMKYCEMITGIIGLMKYWGHRYHMRLEKVTASSSEIFTLTNAHVTPNANAHHTNEINRHLFRLINYRHDSKYHAGNNVSKMFVINKSSSMSRRIFNDVSS